MIELRRKVGCVNCLAPHSPEVQMEFWEFLIQKEGDRSWLPLESPSVEILEGRYRVVARSNRATTATEIRVTHYATNETPPVRRIRKRSSQTNPDGLIVILPFTRLQPGLWELHCTSDIMAEMMGESWQHVVQLDVVPEMESPADDWEPEWQGEVTAAAMLSAAQERSAIEPAGEPIVELAGELTPITAEVPGEPGVDLANLSDSPDGADIDIETDRAVAEESAGAPSELSEAAAAHRIDAAEAEQVEPGEIAEVSSQPTPSSDVIAMLQQIEQQSEQLVDAAFRDLADLTEPDRVSIPFVDAEASSSAIGSEPSSQVLQVLLERETFVIQRGEPLGLTGRVESLVDLSATGQLVVSELRVRLYDPQTSQLLMDEVYPIENRTPPFPFSGTISLPEHYQTYLVLGELIFQGTISSGPQQVLATRSFNVTTDLHELIESLANEFPAAESLPPEVLMPEIGDPLPTSEVNRLNAYSATSFHRSGQQPLPPQLRPPNPTRTHASLDLPSFTPVYAIPTQPDAPEVSDHDLNASEMDLESSEISTSAADLRPEQLEHSDQLSQSIHAVQAPIDAGVEHSDTQLDSPTIEVQSSHRPSIASTSVPESTDRVDALSPELIVPGSSEADAADSFLEWDQLDNRASIWRQRPPRPIDSSNAPEDVSFRALNFQNRFLMRLQSLAANPELAATLNVFEGMDPSHVEQSPQMETASPQQSIGLDADLAAHEIVVDDEFVTAPVSHEDSAAAVPEPLLGSVLPEDEPIPTPRLQLPSGELTAGRPISIIVKMPTLVARVYVKLWLRDRQTRSLIGTPRWLIDFIPDGFGNQMARTDVIVPPGCLKVQFEAIAVEIATQRESDKVTMTRPIVPPDLSPLSLDGLEI